MVEHKLFDGDIPYVSSFEFHEHRERAPHLEQPTHEPRLRKALRFIEFATILGSYFEGFEKTFSDLGCGDGGLLQLVSESVPALQAWGYDFAPSNPVGWFERDVKAESLDVFGKDQNKVKFGNITACTEVLEHIADPHGAVKWIGLNTKYFIASSPWTENYESHDECHAWAWDIEGYRQLIEGGGFTIIEHEKVGMFQVVLAVK